MSNIAQRCSHINNGTYLATATTRRRVSKTCQQSTGPLAMFLVMFVLLLLCLVLLLCTLTPRLFLPFFRKHYCRRIVPAVVCLLLRLVYRVRQFLRVDYLSELFGERLLRLLAAHAHTLTPRSYCSVRCDLLLPFSFFFLNITQKRSCLTTSTTPPSPPQTQSLANTADLDGAMGLDGSAVNVAANLLDAVALVLGQLQT